MMADLVSKSTRWQLVVGYALRCLEPSDAIARRFYIHKALKSAVRAPGLLTQGVKVASRAGRCDGVPAPVCARLIVHTVICERFTLINCVFSQSRRTMLGVACHAVTCLGHLQVLAICCEATFCFSSRFQFPIALYHIYVRRLICVAWGMLTCLLTLILVNRDWSTHWQRCARHCS